MSRSAISIARSGGIGGALSTTSLTPVFEPAGAQLSSELVERVDSVRVVSGKYGAPVSTGLCGFSTTGHEHALAFHTGVIRKTGRGAHAPPCVLAQGWWHNTNQGPRCARAGRQAPR